MNQPSQNFGPPQENWGSGRQQRKDPTLWVPAMIVGAVIFAIGFGGGMAVGWFGGTASGIGGLLNDFDFNAKITIDSTASSPVVGEPLRVTILVTDFSGTDRPIEEIDISGSLIDNADIVSINPDPINTEDYESYQEHYYNTTLPANQSVEFVFELIPKQAGTYRANFTVYMEDYNSESTELVFDVQTQ